jgi:two-component system sensor histidine kinase TctE
VLVPLALLAGVNAVTGHRNALDTANLVADRMLIASARSIAEDTRVEDGQLQVDVPPAALEMFDTGEGDFVYFRVLDAAGRLAAGAADLPLPPTGPEDIDSYEHLYRGRPMRFYALDHTLAGPGPRTMVTVVVGASLEGRDAMVRRLWLAGLIQSLALLATAGVFMVFGLKRGLAPLIRLRDEVRARSAESLEPFAPETVQTEIRPLVDAINDRNTRVRAQLAAQHRFVTNAAHQFRTPLAVLNLQATYASRRVGEADQAAALGAIQDNVAQISRLAEQLLTLSRAEPGSRRARSDRVDLGALARRVLESFTVPALERGIDLGLDERSPGAAAVGDGTMMGEMLANLVDNALRYCPRGSTVTVITGRDADQATLAVRDNGPGLPLGEEQRVFERFYRVPGTEAPGSGLGLSIVKEVAEAAGGTVRASRPAGGGLAIEARLPAAPCDEAATDANPD